MEFKPLPLIMPWKLIDYGPQLWQLYQEDKNFFLSVRCQSSFLEFETLLRLSPEEYREYHALGHVYLEYLASRVSYWQSEYAHRNVAKEHRTAQSQAVKAWQAAHPGESL